MTTATAAPLAEEIDLKLRAIHAALAALDDVIVERQSFRGERAGTHLKVRDLGLADEELLHLLSEQLLRDYNGRLTSRHALELREDLRELRKAAALEARMPAASSTDLAPVHDRTDEAPSASVVAHRRVALALAELQAALADPDLTRGCGIRHGDVLEPVALRLFGRCRDTKETEAEEGHGPREDGTG